MKTYFQGLVSIFVQRKNGQMQKGEYHIQQFIESGQIELAYQLMLSLDKSDTDQAFLDIVARSLPNNHKIHRRSQDRHLFMVDLYRWENRFKIVADLRYFWDATKKDSIYLSVYLFGDLEDFPPQWDNFHIYHPDDSKFMLQQIYEMIELNVDNILAFTP